MHLFLWLSLLAKVTFAGKLGNNCQCTVTGDPHYRTFDNQHITFTGHCMYTLVTTKQGSHLDPFKVEVKNKKRGNMKIPYTDRIDIVLGKHRVQFLRHSNVTIDGSLISLPFSKPGFNVTINQDGVMKLMTNDSVSITYDGRQKSQVTLPLCYAGKVQGLCGDCNGLEDDYRLENGSDVTNEPEKFALIGESYKVPDKNHSDPSCQETTTVTRLKRQTMPFSPYEDLRHICNNISTKGHLEFKPAPKNVSEQVETLRKVCNLMEHFEQTTCEGRRSVFLTCDTPKMRQPRYAKHKEDFYAVNGVHFIRVANAVFHESVVLSVEVTPDLPTCLLGCVLIEHCIGVVYIMGMTCVRYEKQLGVVAVVPGPFQDLFLRVPDVFGDILPVRGGSKNFSHEMLLYVSLDECKKICSQCSKCEGIQYHEWNRNCMVFIGIGENGPVRAVKKGWTYYSFLNRMCSRKCAQNARCLISKISSYCKCERNYVGDGVKECRRI